MVGLIAIQSFVYIAWPPPTTVDGFFQLFQRNWLLGLLDTDLLMIADYVLGPLVFLGLYVLGARLLDVIPVTPIAGNCTPCFAALSYDGCLAITVVADAAHCPDLDVVVEGMQRSWAALQHAVPVAVGAL